MSTVGHPPQPLERAAVGERAAGVRRTAAGRLPLFLRSLLFTLLMVPSTAVFGIAGLLTFPFAFGTRYRVITTWTRLNLWWLARTCRVSFRVRGAENLPAGNAIVLCKHQSAWETMALQLVIPPHVYVLKRELLWIPFFGWGLGLLEPIAIDRKAGRRALQQVAEQGTERLRKGRWVVVYPEGTRVRPGEKGSYSVGGAFLAAHSGYPVVPVAHNAGLYWPRHGFIKYPGTIDLVIGPVIETRGRKASEINALAERWIEDTVAQIMRVPDGGSPPGPPD